MPRGRSRLMDYLARRDMRSSSPRRMRMGDMNYGHYGVRGGEHYPMDSNYPHSQYTDERSRRDYESMGQYDMGYDYASDMRRRNSRGQYMSDRADSNDYGDMNMAHRGNYQPIEAMGYFTGYYGGGEDFARGGRGRGRDMGYDMARGGRRDYGYDYAGDYGENLTKEELEHWRKKLEKEVGDEQSKQFFKKENIEQKARQMGIEMKEFNAEELALASYMLYSDYCDVLKPYIGANMDIYIKLGKAFLVDPDSEVKGGEKLALYHEIVSGEMDD